MAVAPAADGGGVLDAFGRQLLTFAEYRYIGFLAVITLLIFIFWRRAKTQKWPPVEDCIYVCTNTLAAVGGLIVGVVFLLTKPPAVELLSAQALLTIGLFVPIVSLGYALPRLRSLFSPPTPPPAKRSPAKRPQGD